MQFGCINIFLIPTR